MKTFKSIPDLEQVQGDPLYATIKELLLPFIAEYPDHRSEDDRHPRLIFPVPRSNRNLNALRV